MSQQGLLRFSSGGGGGPLLTLSGNSGGPVGPDGFGDINVIGDGTTISVAGNAGTNTLTISALSSVAVHFTADDANIATPAANNLNIFGGANINTTAPGSASTIMVILNDSILLPATTGANTGVIALGADLTTDRFLHNFGNSGAQNSYNTFVGKESGNFSLSPVATSNSSLGSFSLSELTDGYQNCAFGTSSLHITTIGQDNSAYGFLSLGFLTTGNRNISIGASSGGALTTEDDNIFINSNGEAGDNNTIRIGTQGSGSFGQDKTFIAGIYNTAIGATTQIVSIDSDGQLGSSKGNDGQVLIGSTAGSPAWANITSVDNSVTITNGANTIDLSTTGGPDYTVTTNNSTPTPIITRALAVNSAITINATVVAAKSDFTESLWGTVAFGARRLAGGAIAVEAPLPYTLGDDHPGLGVPIVTADVNGNNIRILVVGPAAETWNWKAKATIVTQT